VWVCVSHYSPHLMCVHSLKWIKCTEQIPSMGYHIWPSHVTLLYSYLGYDVTSLAHICWFSVTLLLRSTQAGCRVGQSLDRLFQVFPETFMWVQSQVHPMPFTEVEFSFYSEESPCACCWKTPTHDDDATTTLYCWHGILQVISSVWFSAGFS